MLLKASYAITSITAVKSLKTELFHPACLERHSYNTNLGVARLSYGKTVSLGDNVHSTYDECKNGGPWAELAGKY